MAKADSTIIRAVLAGDVDAFGALVARYQEAVYAVAWSWVRDFASAEDIAQDTFIRAYTRLSELRDPRAFPTWLRRIAANVSRVWLRDRSREHAGLDVERLADSHPGEADGLREEVLQILSSLPQAKREVAILCYMQGVSRKNAAHFLGVSEVALRKRLHDAKRLLQRRIAEAAHKSFQEHLLPRDFGSRCVCGCKRSVGAYGKEITSMYAEKKDCGCGCLPRGKTKARAKQKPLKEKVPKARR